MARRMLRLKTRFYVILALLLIGVAVILVLALGDETSGTLKNGSMDYAMEVTATVIRDEVSLGIEQRYDRIAFLAREGEMIYEAMPIARAFKWGYSDDMLQSLLTAEAEIYAEQMAQISGIEDADLANIDLRISQKRAEIAGCVQNPESGNLLTLETELKALLSERATYLRGKVQPTEQLNTLYQNEETRRALVESYVSEVTATRAGLVSFYFDGYEQTLTADKLSMINADLVSGAIKASGGFSGGASNNLVCRIVEPANWYLAFVTPKGGLGRIAGGVTYAAVFDGYPSLSYSGLSVGNVVHESGVLNVLEFHDNIGPLLSARTVKVKLMIRAEGLALPLSCIAIVENQPVVRISGSSGEYNVAVDILAQDEERAIVKARNETDTLAEGLRFVKP